ncbi:NAD kinase [Babesia gibsoni]|uniref:NAD kinase n=1 Tax=Babesia gibsoni TaxID=33632 RepID=A0AAD8P865_BABGI|nr:NAD kinase [Babesia gibsoni]
MAFRYTFDPAVVAKVLSSTSEGSIPSLGSDITVVFERKPKKILICSSKCNDSIKSATLEVFKHIRQTYNCVLMVHDQFLPAIQAETVTLWGKVYQPRTEESNDLISLEFDKATSCLLETDDVELIIAIGGDGTILKVLKMFPNVLPPIIGLSMGSMGYMAEFNMSQLKKTLGAITSEGLTVSRRSLLNVEIYNEVGELIARRNALNECVVDRGMSASIATLDVYYHGSYFTTITGDGLLVSTPSGSTAYSMSAGGPIVHPAVASMLFTVICPHSISYRPLVLPSDSVLEIVVPEDNRSSVRLCVDGNYHCNLSHGCYVKVTTSETAFPLALPNKTCTTDEWNRALKEHLHWNLRVRQQKLQSPSRIAGLQTQQRFNTIM